MGLKFKIVISDYDEKKDKKLNPHKLAQKLSLGKAKKVAKKHKNSIIISADTIVVFKNQIIGKPLNKQDAKNMLKLLSGNIHSVITGFTIIDSSSGKIVTQSVESKVYFKDLTNEEIDAYVATGEPLDKAGAYGIQEKGGKLIEKVEGDYDNVVGLPIRALVKELRKFGVKITQSSSLT